MAQLFGNVSTLLQGISDALEFEKSVGKDTDENSTNQQFLNICSWLLALSPHELTLLSTILGVIISYPLTTEEKSVIASFLGNIGATIGLIASQEAFIKIATAEQNALVTLQKSEMASQLKKNEVYEAKIEKEKINRSIKEIQENIEKLNLAFEKSNISKK